MKSSQITAKMRHDRRFASRRRLSPKPSAPWHKRPHPELHVHRSCIDPGFCLSARVWMDRLFGGMLKTTLQQTWTRQQAAAGRAVSSGFFRGLGPLR